MKKQALTVAVAFLVSIVTAGACYAQRPSLVVNIPFAFHAGDKTRLTSIDRIRIELVIRANSRHQFAVRGGNKC